MSTFNNQMPTMNTYYNPQQQYVDARHFNSPYAHGVIPTMTPANHQVPAMGTYPHPSYQHVHPPNLPVMTAPNHGGSNVNQPFHPQYHHSTYRPTYTTTPNYNNWGPTMGTSSRPHPFTKVPQVRASFSSYPHHGVRTVGATFPLQHRQQPHFPGYPVHTMAPSNYQWAPAVTANHSSPSNQAPNDQVGPMVTTSAAAVNPSPLIPSSGNIDPALFFLARPAPLPPSDMPLPENSRGKQPAVIIDLTNDDNEEEENGGNEPEEVAEPAMTSTTNTTSTTELILPKEATPPPRLKPLSLKRNYAWLQQPSLLPDMPNSKRTKMSREEDAYRQQYQTRAANSTASHFLGLKTGWATEDMPLSLLNPSSSVSGGDPGPSSSSSTLCSSSTMTERAQKKGDQRTKGSKRMKAGEKQTGEEEGQGRDEEGGVEDADKEDAAFATEIEAAFADVDDEAEKEEEEEEVTGENDDDDDDDMAAEIEAMFDEEDMEEGKEQEGTAGLMDAELEAALANPSQTPAEEQVFDEELRIDEDPEPGQCLRPLHHGPTVWSTR